MVRLKVIEYLSCHSCFSCSSGRLSLYRLSVEVVATYGNFFHRAASLLVGLHLTYAVLRPKFGFGINLIMTS